MDPVQLKTVDTIIINHPSQTPLQILKDEEMALRLQEVEFNSKPMDFLFERPTKPTIIAPEKFQDAQPSSDQICDPFDTETKSDSKANTTKKPDALVVRNHKVEGCKKEQIEFQNQLIQRA